ncbi:MAG: circularly permuted type 2 ATP-grasp protein [Nitrospiraceae bacterium]|nr:circularly permuted type 2 ATP-grasp protein [Nitrospiraceae bacterium]
MRYTSYDPENFFDELFESVGQPRASALLMMQKIQSLPDGELKRRQQAAEGALLAKGVTFSVYGNGEGVERIFPFDAVPRLVETSDWERIERGLQQRVMALNLFIDDVYHEQKIMRDGVVPADLIYSSKGFLRPCIGFNPPKGIWCHVSGIDLVRDRDGTVYVLEDNIRCPSGVAYVLGNRELMKSTLPELFNAYRVRPVDDYPSRLLDTLHHLSNLPKPTAVILTPGIYNSAYFEHSFLAQQMGVELVEGSDLVVMDGSVQMRTTKGFQRVDVIYRRINDDSLDPKVFDQDSLIGVPGLMDVYRQGRVALANAPGTGVADDKVIYVYVPRMIQYYLGEEPILPNVRTYICRDPKDRDYVLEHLDTLVVKVASESGGYGMLVGPYASKREREECADRIKAHPRNYLAQPTLALSRVPCIVGDHFEGRHVDLRPYILYGKEIYITPGGLTRVALTKGSLVVNSSQGGGSKDTWVLSKAAGSAKPAPADVGQGRISGALGVGG